VVISSYRNFELVVNKDSANPQQLSVQVLNSPVGNQAKPQFTSIPPSLQRDLRWLEERRLSVDEITELGETLANLLFPGEVRVFFIRSLDKLDPQQGLRLQLRLDPTLASVPWEYLYIQQGTGERDSSGFLALDPRISIVRYEALDLSGEFDKTPRSRRLLVALASPTDQDLLNLDQESTNIKNTLQGVPGIEADFLQNATVQSLNDKLMTRADIFHFAGHGIFNMNPGTKTGEGALVLVGEDGKSAFMPADQVAMNLRGRGVQLVILGACHTGRRDEQNVWSGVVAALMRVGIPAAVAMQYKVWDDGAIAFGRSFYKALAAGLPLDQALSAGRLAVFNLCHPLRNDTERGKFWRDWGVAVLYLRAEEEFILPTVADTVQCENLVKSLSKDTHKLTSSSIENRRCFEAAMPQISKVGQPTEIKVMVALPNSPGLRAHLPVHTKAGDLIAKKDVVQNDIYVEFPIDPTTQEPLPTNIFLSVQAPDFEIDEPIINLHVPLKHDSGVLTFVLTPRERQKHGLVVVQWFKDEQRTVLVGSLALRTEIRGVQDELREGIWDLITLPLNFALSSVRPTSQSINIDYINGQYSQHVINKPFNPADLDFDNSNTTRRGSLGITKLVEDYVDRDKIVVDYFSVDNIDSDKVGSDKITVGSITNSTGIAIGRNASANVRIINQLQDSNNPEAQRLADLLKQLQSIVTTKGSGLSPKNQEKALKHLDAIGKFGRDQQNSDLQDDAETALDALPTILSQGTGLNQTQIKSLLESIQEVLGL
jgi:hypothetical protein